MTIFAPNLLQGQTAIVTGGGTGIGRGIALEFARLGANVVICSRKLEHLTATAADIRACGGESLALQADIRDVDAVSRTVRTVLDRFGRVDVLVNNAGGQFASASARISTNGWNAVINTNLNGTWYMTREVATQWMIPHGGGKIINIVACLWRGMPGLAHTGAARAGVVNLTKSLSIEWAPHNIRVNCIAPGNILTDGWEQAYGPGRAEDIRVQIPLQRFGAPEDIAYAAVFLASPAGDYITGATLAVDGGQQHWGNIDYTPEES